MTAPPDMRLPPRVDRDAVLARLDRVLDPELDESVLTLGFVASVHGDSDGELTVELRLPTYWCAANFSYLMASDVQRELGQVDGVSRVSVRLPEHFAGDAIESGAGPGKSFAEAFPEGGPDTLEQTRRLFLRKGFFTRTREAAPGTEASRSFLPGNRGPAGGQHHRERRSEDRRAVFGTPPGTGPGLLGLFAPDRRRQGCGDIAGRPRNVLHTRPDDASVHGSQRFPLLCAVGGKTNQPVSFSQQSPLPAGRARVRGNGQGEGPTEKKLS